MESGYRGTGIREIQDGDGNQDLGVRGLGSGDPGTGIRVSGVSGDWDLGIGGQILDTHIKFEGVGIEIWVSGVRGLGSGSGCHAWDLGGLGSGDCMVIQSSNLRDLGIQDWDPGYPGTGI